jgi:chromosome segregation protein
MRLKRLELFGFKSFLDKTNVNFKPGITAIVGPNGCGKSNLTDAVLWAFGEQRPKNLRGEKMEDVIFNGTEHRKPLGLAEVSITVDDIRDPLPTPYSPYSEITFMRRLYRSGESEYFINQTPCRLKDIRELLIDLKAGYRAHTIIEQGRIEDLLMASPLERRELVEEVAGVAKFRLRKEEAERKLAATQQNLVRLQDVLSEVKRQINALDRQAKQARKYQTLYEELKSLEIYMAGVEWQEWTTIEAALSREDQLLQEQLAQKEAETASYGLKISTLQLSLAEAEQAIGKDKDQMAEITGKMGRAEGKVERIHAQKKEWDETKGRTEVELVEMTRTASALVEEQNTVETEHLQVSGDLTEIEGRLHHLQETSRQMALDLTQKNQAVEKERSAVFDCQSCLTEARNNVTHFEARKTLLLGKRETDSVKKNEIEQKRDTTGRELTKLQSGWTEITNQWTREQEALNGALHHAGTTAATLKEKEESFYKVKEKLARTEAALASKEGFYLGLLSPVIDKSHPVEGAAGFVTDLMDVPSEYEKAIEAVLGERLRGIVIDDLHGLKKGIEQLRSLKKGRGTLILRTTPTPQGDKGEAPPGVIGPAASFISCKEGYEEVVARLLDQVFIARDIDSVYSLWENNVFPKGVLFVTLGGELFWSNGVVSAGEASGEVHLFEKKREIAALSEETGRLQVETKQAAEAIEDIRKEQQTTQLTVEQTRATVARIETQRQTLQKEINTLALLNEKMELTYETCLAEQDEEDQELAELTQKREEEEAEIVALEQLKGQKGEGFAQLLKDRDAFQVGHQELKEKQVALQLTATSLKGKQQHLLEKRGQMNRSSFSLKTGREDKGRLLTSLQEKWKVAEQEEGEAVLEIQTLSSSSDVIRETIRGKTETHADLLAGFASLQAQEQEARGDRDRIVSARNEKSVRRLTAQMAKQKTQETIFTQYQIHIDTDTPPLGPAGDAVLAEETTPVEAVHALPPSALKEKRDQLRVSLQGVGPVHLGAIEEYQELTQRYEFLKEQEKDLVVSTEDLNTAIVKINQTTKGLFVDTFHLLNGKFGEMFVSFFGGGKGELVLSDAANPMESGVEIVAAPPGKKPRTLNLLSGGEKALTGLSLLFSTFLIGNGGENHSIPFCILDEVDAALDEENSRRFAQAIERLSERSQFIVVTHNKRTMEKASVLYGVTAESAGVSRLVSVSLKEI